jgi:TonB family protein
MKISNSILILLFLSVYTFGQKNSSVKNYQLGTSALESKNFPEAISLLTLSIDENPTANAFFNRAVAHYNQGDTCSFCNDLKNAEKLNDLDAKTLFLKNCILSKIIGNIPDSLKLNHPYISKLEILYNKCNQDSTVIVWSADKGHSDSILLVDFEALGKDFFLVVDDPPEFTGGDFARMKFLQNNIRYPKEARDSGIQGIVYLSFTVEKDGTISNITIRQSPNIYLSEEASRVVRLMPKWKPGSILGKPVRVQFTMPIKFTLAR